MHKLLCRFLAADRSVTRFFIPTSASKRGSVALEPRVLQITLCSLLQSWSIVIGNSSLSNILHGLRTLSIVVTHEPDRTRCSRCITTALMTRPVALPHGERASGLRRDARVIDVSPSSPCTGARAVQKRPRPRSCEPRARPGANHAHAQTPRSVRRHVHEGRTISQS